jgi:hypothetical protein
MAKDNEGGDVRIGDDLEAGEMGQADQAGGNGDLGFFGGGLQGLVGGVDLHGI